MTVPTPPRPKKRLGQHFLIDPNIVRKILSVAALCPQDTVLEIGPGRGALTRPLCEAVSRVIAIELDPGLAAYLTQTCTQYTNLDLRVGDALEFSYESLPQGTVVVANLPYYVSTPLLFRLFEARNRIRLMILMLQLEVARRLVARPATPDYGALSVLGQYFADPVIAFTIPGTCFRPRPDVGSAVVCLPPRNNGLGNSTADEAFVQTVRAAFAHRRKTLVNSFRDAGIGLSDIHTALDMSGIDPRRRAETLTVSEFMTLTEALHPA